MKKNSKKARKIQREKDKRLAQESAKGKATPDSRRSRKIHTCPHYILGYKAYDYEWERSIKRNLRPWNNPTGEDEDTSILIMTIYEFPRLHLKHAKFRGTMNNYIRPISATECQCSQCHKKFPIETMEILKEMKELQAQRYKYRDLDNGLWENYEDKEIREKIEELEKKIPPVRYRKLSPIDFIYVDEE